MEQVQIKEFEPDLFAGELPTMQALKKLSLQVHSSEVNLAAFSELIEQNISRTNSKTRLAAGIGLFILGRDAEAVKKLEKSDDCTQKYMYLGYSLRRMKMFDEAIANFDKSTGFGADSLAVALEKIATYRQAHNFQAAQKLLKSCENFKNVSAEYHYQLGRLQEEQGLYNEAMDNYKAALELDPEHQQALFRLAYRCDLSGDEQAAIDFYKQIAANGPVYVSALLNLAVLYEDGEQYDKATQCVDEVLKYHPNHKRANLFKKDIESSKTMVYDEEKEERKTRKTQILETPISDFELSVRSRNCLKKMKIETLGDLLRITEAELLSYKNFGETSLREIKSILDSRGLYLGIELEEKANQATGLPDESQQESEEQALLSKPTDDLQLSIRARKALHALGIRTLGELVRKTDAELLGCKNFGVTSLNEVKKALANFGLSLRVLEQDA